MSTSTFSLAALLLLAACAAPVDRGPRTPDRDDVGLEDVGTLPVGLSADDVETLTELGVPVVVPSDPGTFEVVELEASAVDRSASYSVRYQRADGACFELSGGSEGFGGPSLPIVSTDVRVNGLGRTVRVHEASRDPGATSAQVWGAGTIVSEFIDLDGASALFLSDTAGGCRPVTLDEGVQIVRSLVQLQPSSRSAAGVGPLGAFAPAEDLLERVNAASSPELAADAIARRYSGEADRVTVDVLSESGYEAVALVTAFGLRDDSIRDERLRLTYTPYDGTWELTAAGRQVRCWQGRGHQGWSDQACL